MIHFNSLITDFVLKKPDVLKEWLVDVILKEEKTSGELNFIFCTDNFLLEINRNFLQHDFYTDIITFPTSLKPNIISGEIYLSIDRIKENAVSNHEKFEKELARVLVHGVLHLIGYNDHTSNETTIMRTKEDNYLLLLPEF